MLSLWAVSLSVCVEVLVTVLWVYYIYVFREQFITVQSDWNPLVLSVCINRLDFSLTEDEENNTIILDLAVYR